MIPSTFIQRMVITVAALAACFAARATEPVAELIFPAQSQHVHSSSIAECPNGDLIAVWFQGSGERTADDVKLNGARLRKGATAWSDVFQMADTPDHPDCNPTLLVDAKQRLWLFWVAVQAGRWECSVLKYRRADNYTADGPPQWSWQDVILLKPGAEFEETMKRGFKELDPNESMWAEYAHRYTSMLIESAADARKRETGWMTRAKPIQLASGRLLLPLYSDGFNAGLMAISDDAGDSWRASAPIIGMGPIQPTLARGADGTLTAYMRDSGAPPMRVHAATSKDSGQTWSVATDTALPNPGSSLAIETLKDGRWVLLFNDTEDGRHRMAAALSSDEGKTWPAKRYLDRDETRKDGFGYPTVIQSADGALHVTYTHSTQAGKSIKHVRFSAEWILEREADR